MNYNLEERTATFAEKIIITLKKLKINAINRRIIDQLIGCSGSVGANYNEANEGESKKDFYHKIQIAKKEIKESLHWIRLLAVAEPSIKTELKSHWQEAHELLLIFSKILVSRKN